MSNNQYKTIRITKETHNLLASKGTLHDSYDTVIQKLIKNQRVQENLYDPK